MEGHGGPKNPSVMGRRSTESAGIAETRRWGAEILSVEQQTECTNHHPGARAFNAHRKMFPQIAPYDYGYPPWSSLKDYPTRFFTSPNVALEIGIVGAGIAGLTAAIALSRCGHNVEVRPSEQKNVNSRPFEIQYLTPMMESRRSMSERLPTSRSRRSPSGQTQCPCYGNWNSTSCAQRLWCWKE
jgi:hypothetical protein